MAPVFIFLEVVAIREQEEVVSIIFAEHFLWKKRSPGRGKKCATLTQEILLKNLIGTPMPDVTATCITGLSSAELQSQKMIW